MAPPIPIQHYLVPPEEPTVPEELTVIDQIIDGGLPHTIRLDDQTTLVLTLPTGLATAWRDLNSNEIVSISDDEYHASAKVADGTSGEFARAAARVVVRQGDKTVAAVPLAAGVRRVAGDDGTEDGGAVVEFMILDWILHSGTMREAGDFGSRIRLAWRRIDRAVSEFSTPPPHRQVLARVMFLAVQSVQSAFVVVRRRIRLRRFHQPGRYRERIRL